MKVSIIIPTYNRKDLLEKCLRSIYDSSFKRGEVIVVDDCSTDRTSEIVKSYSCKYIRLEENKGVGYARNRGAKEAKGDILVFIDSDVVLKKDTLHNMIENFKKQPDVKVMCGYKLPENLSQNISSNLVMLRKTYSTSKWLNNTQKVITNSFLESAFFAIRKCTFEEFGGFTTNFSSSGGEDHELGHRISKKYKIFFFKNLGVYHHFEPTSSYLKKLPLRSYYWGTLFGKRKKFEEKGVATSREAVNSALALGSLTTIFLAILFSQLGYVALVLFATLFVHRISFHYFAYKKGNIFYALASVPFDYLCYSINASSGITGLVNARLQKIKHQLEDFRCLIKAFTSKTPSNIGLFVTSRCNLLCKHCFYWKQIKESKNKKELTLDEIKRISKNLDTLYYLTITGGEPSLREDLPEICETFYKNNNLRMISLHTNGMLPAKIKEQTEQILQRCEDVKINVGIGVDGLEKTHNFIRGNKKSFNNIIRTIKLLKTLQLKYPNLDIQCCSTFSSYSKNDLLNAASYFQNNLGIQFGQTFIRGDPYDKYAKNVSLKDFEMYYKKRVHLKKMRKMFRTPYFAIVRQVIGHFTPSIVMKTLSEKRQVIPCKAGVKTVVISETGDVFPCEMLNKKLGDLRKENYDLKEILSKDKSQRIIKDIKDKKCYCTHEGNIYINLVFNYRSYPKYLRQALRVIQS